MTDFSSMLARPKLMLLGAAAQMGIYFTLLSALALGFTPREAGSIAIIGGADGPTSIFLTAKLAPHLIGSVAIAAYSYMALIPIIQPPIMRLLTTEKERKIHMPEDDRVVSRKELLFLSHRWASALLLFGARFHPAARALLFRQPYEGFRRG